jgi:hypothetical protein
VVMMMNSKIVNIDTIFTKIKWCKCSPK